MEVNWSYQFFLSIYLYTVNTLHTKQGVLGCNSPNVRNSVNTLFPQSFRVLTPPALSVFTPFFFVDSEHPDMLRYTQDPFPLTRTIQPFQKRHRLWLQNLVLLAKNPAHKPSITGQQMKASSSTSAAPSAAH